MDFLYERVAYLRGLAEGLGVEEESNEGKVIANIIDVLEDFAEAINELYDYQEDLDEYVEAIDEDLADVEDELYEDEDDDEDFDDFDDFDDYDYIEVECPHCKEYVYLDEDLLNNDKEVICPNCHKVIDLLEECHCDCDDDKE